MQVENLESHANKLLRIDDVVQLTAMSKAWVYGQIAAGKFPCGVKVGEHSRRWRAVDIAKWLENLTK